MHILSDMAERFYEAAVRIEDQQRLQTLAVLLAAGCTQAEARAWITEIEKEAN